MQEYTLYINLIFVAIQLPGLNGYEANMLIRKFYMDIIIYAQTAFSLSGDRDKSIEAGSIDYISKPIVKGELLALLRKYFLS